MEGGGRRGRKGGLEGAGAGKVEKESK